MWAKNKQAGFTIVELLIVIVVIGILAAITIVAYNGVTQKAAVASLQSDLDSASKQLKLYQVDNSAYPIGIDCSATPAANTICLKSSGGTTYTTFTPDNTTSPQTFCLTATNGTTNYFINQDGAPGSGGCSVTNIQTNPQLATDSSGYSTQTPTGNSSSRTTGTGPSGEATYNVITTTSGQLRIAFRTITVPAQAGEKYNMSFYLYSDTAIASSNIEVNLGGWTAFPTAPITIGWQRYSAIVTIPSNSTSFSNAQLLTTNGINVPAGANFKMTKVQITKGPTLYNYADGSSPGWIWNGIANASTSTGIPL